MPRYYFDIRDNGALATDEEGLVLVDLRAAEVEAARSLADMARDMPPGTAHQAINDSDADVEFLVVSTPPSHGDRIPVDLDARS